jgi:hypothetical protein
VGVLEDCTKDDEFGGKSKRSEKKLRIKKNCRNP